MIKKATVAVLIAGLGLTLMPAQAKALARKNITFTAEVPCHFVCAYWTNPLFAPDPTTFDPTTDDPEAFADRAADRALLTAHAGTPAGCTHPTPEGSYDDKVVKAPKKATWLVFEAWPEVDWDIFVCAAPKKGKTGSRYITSGANSAGAVGGSGDDLCSQTADTLGCPEKIQISVKAGRKYVLRAYNWADPSPLRARYSFYR
jgi:hypothetical protein